MRAGRSKTGLFLLELALGMLIFIVAAAICLRVFAQAGLRSRAANHLSEAVVAAQSAAECFRAADGDLEQTARLLDAQLAQQTLTQTCGNLLLTMSHEGLITVTDSAQTQIYTLCVAVPGGDAP